jgi:hypothetical protein
MNYMCVYIYIYTIIYIYIHSYTHVHMPKSSVLPCISTFGPTRPTRPEEDSPAIVVILDGFDGDLQGI